MVCEVCYLQFHWRLVDNPAVLLTCRYNETNGYVPAAYLKTLKETQTFGSEKEQVTTNEDFSA